MDDEDVDTLAAEIGAALDALCVEVDSAKPLTDSGPTNICVLTGLPDRKLAGPALNAREVSLQQSNVKPFSG